MRQSPTLCWGAAPPGGGGGLVLNSISHVWKEPELCCLCVFLSSARRNLPSVCVGGGICVKNSPQTCTSNNNISCLSQV